MKFDVKKYHIKLFVVVVLTFSNLLTISAKAVTAPVKVCLTPIGHYMTAKKLTPQQLYIILQGVGFKGHALKVAWAVAMKETHGNPLAHNYNPSTGDNSYGVFQINLYGALKGRLSHYGLKSAKQLTDPIKNAQIAFSMSSGGKNWSPWHSNPGQRDYWVVKQWMDKYPAIT